MFYIHHQKSHSSVFQLLVITDGESALVLLVGFPLGHLVGLCKNWVLGYVGHLTYPAARLFLCSTSADGRSMPMAITTGKSAVALSSCFWASHSRVIPPMRQPPHVAGSTGEADPDVDLYSGLVYP